MARIRIQFTLFSAFYAPLISTFAGGFLEAEGLEAEWSVSPPGRSAIAALEDGSADVVQSALSQGLAALDRGETPRVVHFAQINEMDGFFLTGRPGGGDFSWDRLEGAGVILFRSGQPRVMFEYACRKAGVDFDRIEAIHVGGAAEMDAAFRAGAGDYVHQQGPYPQRLVADGVGRIAAQVGPLVGPCGFSSLAAAPEWLETDMARAFLCAYARARRYMNDAPAAEIAAALRRFFPDVAAPVLADCIAAYQRLGCWTPHVEITRPAYEAALDIFASTGGLKRRYRYEQVCAAPPAARTPAG